MLCFFFYFAMDLNMCDVSWQIEDVPGNDEVILKRKFGNEQYVSGRRWSCVAGSDLIFSQRSSIRLIFSIADLQGADGDGNVMVPMDAEDGASEDGEASYPLRCAITITKVHTSAHFYAPALLTRSAQPSVPGALSIDAICQESAFVLENVSYYNDGKLATDVTAEADWKRRGVYIGPQVRPIYLITGALSLSVCPSSLTPSTLTSRRSLKDSSKNVASTRAWRCSFPNTHSIRNKRYAVVICGCPLLTAHGNVHL
jgi:hypothetical protein